MQYFVYLQTSSHDLPLQHQKKLQKDKSYEIQRIRKERT